jgi:hypothetical protein
MLSRTARFLMRSPRDFLMFEERKGVSAHFALRPNYFASGFDTLRLVR